VRHQQSQLEQPWQRGPQLEQELLLLQEHLLEQELLLLQEHRSVLLLLPLEQGQPLAGQHFRRHTPPEREQPAPTALQLLRYGATRLISTAYVLVPFEATHGHGHLDEVLCFPT
jgi:hypothetical protein